MNERIKELAEQNGFIHKWQPPGEQYEKLQTLEKFAELIVKECASICEARSDPLGYANLTSEANAKAIREHFGVADVDR